MNQKQGDKQEDVELIVFGDSFVRVFSLVPDVVQHRAFKGATLKGITKPDNANRKAIQAQLEQRRGKRVVAIFNFGQVDVNFSAYYDAFYGKERDHAAIAEEYCTFIKGLPAQLKIVMGPYPSPIRSENILRVLDKYAILPPESISESKQLLEELSLPGTAMRRFWTFRAALRQKAIEAGLIFFDLSRQILDLNSRVKSQFVDLSPVNIHILWKPTIFLIVEKLKWLGLKQTDIIPNLDEIEQKYIDKKTDRLKQLLPQEIITRHQMFQLQAHAAPPAQAMQTA